MRFENKESFQHKMAKELLHSWITDKWEGVDGPARCNIKFIDEKTKRDVSLIAYQTDFIFMEYPITTDFPLLIDENNCNCAIPCDIYRSTQKYCPCLKCHKFNKNKLQYVADIAIEYKGAISTIIEIVHKHPTQEEKKRRYDELPGEAFEIQASHIMGQIQKPNRLFVKVIN